MAEAVARAAIETGVANRPADPKEVGRKAEAMIRRWKRTNLRIHNVTRTSLTIPGLYSQSQKFRLLTFLAYSYMVGMELYIYKKDH